MRKLTWTRVAAAALIAAASAGTAFAANNIGVPNGILSGQCANGNPNTVRFGGNCGALVTLDDATTNPAYVQENNPSAETAYRVRLYVNLRLLTMTSGDAFDLFAAYNGADPPAGSSSGEPTIRVEVQQTGSNKHILVAARRDDDTEATATSAALSRGWHSIEFSWVRSTGPGNNNGTLNWWIDGFPQTALTGIDNDAEVVHYARWGAVAGLEASTQGTVRIDDYASQRSGYIGPAVPFSDVPTSHFAWRFIQGAYGTEIIPEASIGTFNPNGNIARKEMLKWVLLGRYGSGYTPPACTPPGTFADVPCPAHPYADFIYDGVAQGITSGCGGGNFCPEGTVNRAEMAVFLLQARGIGSSHPCPPATFLDVPTGNPFCPFANEIAFQGITAGCGGGNYCPTGLVNRAQMSVFIQQNFAGFNVTSPQVGP